MPLIPEWVVGEAIGGGDNAVIFQYLPAPAGVQLISATLYFSNITLAEFRISLSIAFYYHRRYYTVRLELK